MASDFEYEDLPNESNLKKIDVILNLFITASLHIKNFMSSPDSITCFHFEFWPILYSPLKIPYIYKKKTLSCNIVTSQGATSYNSQYLWQLVDETFELPSFKGTFPSVPVVVVAVAVEEGRIIKRSRDIYSKCDNRVTVLLLIVFLSLPPPSLPPLQRFADYQYQSILPLNTNKLGI